MHRALTNMHAQDEEDDKVVSDQQQQQALTRTQTRAFAAEKEKSVPQPPPALEEPLVLEASQTAPLPKQRYKQAKTLDGNTPGQEGTFTLTTSFPNNLNMT